MRGGRTGEAVCVQYGERSVEPLPPPHTPSPTGTPGAQASGAHRLFLFFSEGRCDLFSLTPAELWVPHLQSGNFPLEKRPCHRTRSFLLPLGSLLPEPGTKCLLWLFIGMAMSVDFLSRRAHLPPPQGTCWGMGMISGGELLGLTSFVT